MKGAEKAKQDLSSINTQDLAFREELRVFCHFYQIPFLEDNSPKTTKNAAKIYMRMQADGVDLHSNFKGSQLESFFKSISEEDLSEEFDPFRLKEKWKRFFRGGLTQKPELDTDRVLKNRFSPSQGAYINDNMLAFNDNQLLRVLYIMRNTSFSADLKLKDLVSKQIENNLI